jgi:hypothetical protein
VDQVYSFEIPEKAVLVVSLSGETGSQLGLYLFDQSSTSILSNTPVAQAAKPGGRQTLVRSYLEPARVYINVNGRNLDRPYAYSLQVTLLVDTSPPVFRELIVPATTKTAELCVYISASDPTSSVREVSVGESNNAPDWVSYVGPAQYCTDLAPGTLQRQIAIAAKNGIGLIARRVVGVIIDDFAPQLMSSMPAGEVLLTPGFRVVVKRRCPEGMVVCDRVSYLGVDRQSGASLRLMGKTLHVTCIDGVTPCRFLGYEFRHGAYVYVVSDDGRLEVSRSGTILRSEQGEWQR